MSYYYLVLIIINDNGNYYYLFNNYYLSLFKFLIKQIFIVFIILLNFVHDFHSSIF